MAEALVKPFIPLAEMTLADFNVLCTKAEGRDKLARFFQYLARAIVGSLGYMHPTAGTLLAKLEGHARTVMVQLAGARRTFRWCKEFPVIQSLPKCLEISDPIDRVFELLQKASLSIFLVTDHIGMLKQWKILTGGKRSGTGTIQLGLKFFCFSNFVAGLYQLKKVKDMGNKDEKKEQRRKCYETAVKHALLVVQTAHLSLLYQTHDAIVGLAGVITSSIDVIGQLPAKPKVSPDAKASSK
mmetsp:Transcript_104234/g.185198  ORF Transcript_104234/g.185198 Transcript_104234/m.185198 type:complete len:241 (+) Transcript_104234:57-779(+)|eukprot:CAMPEP_0197663674 /NCGR_PEP_ID=MMETSP1338-20131121/58173_1 /TAXON_ID=43686 ORGANISM="Pelagodinium beii, Strain RCC1491" /NCGR_SAMPLE_ID=MMETSP1338 /ASSEMBLY_ACC=CAM_ASM_000754 /LENGTH=240 /DNA_ID=CAMNT_0043242155 /DNA_START=57 /DNA_END=779 /DNA_ORIENTATION=+